MHDTEDKDDCSSCGEGAPRGECSKSGRDCGHHCNHSWSHERCCWCGETFGEQGGADDAQTR